MVLSVLTDYHIRAHGFIEGLKEENLNSYGYDLTLGQNFKIPLESDRAVDPFDPPPFRDHFAYDVVVIPPGSFVLGESEEYVRMPDNVIGVCLGRSTYARAGLITHVTPLEPGWHGKVTIEMSNSAPYPVIVRVGVGITQVLFYTSEIPEKSYTAKGGRYDNQVGVTQGIGIDSKLSNGL